MSPQAHSAGIYRCIASLLCLIPVLGVSAGTQNPPSPAGATDQRIRFFQAQLARDPEYYLNYNRLAAAYSQKARESGDVSYYQLAEQALTNSLQLESKHEEAAQAWEQLGAVQFAEHRFGDAAASARRALALSNDASAHALSGDAQLETGDLDLAEAEFNAISPSRDGAPHPGITYLELTRKSALKWIRGEVQQSTAALREALGYAERAHLPAENLAWTHFMLGQQLFQSGDLPGAESEILSALKKYPNYHRALAGLAQVRAAQGRLPEAADLYTKAMGIIPLPAYAAALGDIYARLGKNADAEKQYALVEYIGALSALNKQVYNRELAVFYADHDRNTAQAVELAKKELELRHDVYTWDALAWTLLKAGRTAEAREPMQKALALGTRDPLLFFHAGAIERAQGELEQSSAHLRRALAINPEFHVLYARQARDWLATTESAKLSPRSGNGAQ